MRKWLERRRRRREARAAAEEARRREQEEVLRAGRHMQAAIVEVARAGAFPDIDWASEYGLSRLPFRFQKSERPFLVLPHVEYAESKARRRTVGRSSGASFRVAKGVSVRTGGWSGTPVHYEETVSYGQGIFAVTNKHVYFSGDRKNTRIRHDRIVTFDRGEKGWLQVTRERVSGLPEFFAVGEFWLDCVIDLMDAAPDADFGRKEPEMRGIEVYADTYVFDGGDEPFGGGG